MKITLFMEITVIVDLPDDDAAVGTPLPKGPLNELAARLRREARYGRDHGKRDVNLCGVTTGMEAAYEECFAEH
jgi:hypothetical protein